MARSIGLEPVLYEAVRPVVRGMTPEPGGVGPVTTMMVLRQTVEVAERAADADGFARVTMAGDAAARRATRERPAST